MEIAEPVGIINRQLLDNFGRFTDGRATWRVVWSDDQKEQRFGTYKKTDNSGNYLGEVEEWREGAKYPYILHRFVLERLTPVPDVNTGELTEKTSYEPVWTFETEGGDALPPNFAVSKVVIDIIHERAREAVAAKTTGPKYKMPELEMQTPEAIAERVRLLQESMYGNETPAGDALAQDSAVGFGVRRRRDEMFLKDK